MSNEQPDPVEDFLAHYGVKGMKWGVRKKRPSSKEIKAARRLERNINREYGSAQRAYMRATTAKGKAQAEKVMKDLDAQDQSNWRTATKLTRGEQAALLIFATPVVGLGVIAANAIITREPRSKSTSDS